MFIRDQCVSCLTLHISFNSFNSFFTYMAWRWRLEKNIHFNDVISEIGSQSFLGECARAHTHTIDKKQ